MADRVTITFADGAGETRDYSFTIDDYDRRLASGDVDKYLTERALVKLRRDWKPFFRETGRTVERGLCCVMADCGHLEPCENAAR